MTVRDRTDRSVLSTMERAGRAVVPSRRRSPDAGDLVREALLGAATGARSTFGPTALALWARAGDRGVAGRIAPWAPLAVLAAVGEASADKTPVVPPRTGIVGLAPRVLFAFAAGRVLAIRDRRPHPTSGAVAAVAAIGAAFGGTRWRAAAARWWGSDLPGALLEDAAAGTAAAIGVLRPRDAVASAGNLR